MREAELGELWLRVERVDFDLVHGGRDRAFGKEVLQASNGPIAYADGACQLGLVETFHSLPCWHGILRQFMVNDVLCEARC